MSDVARRASVALVVDDEESVRLAVSKMLERLGFQVLAGGNDLEASELAFKARHIAVAVIDMKLRNQSGVEVLGAIRSAHPGVPVLFMSGDPQSLERVRNPTATTSGVLAKPFTFQQLEASIAALLSPQTPKP